MIDGGAKPITSAETSKKPTTTWDDEDTSWFDEQEAVEHIWTLRALIGKTDPGPLPPTGWPPEPDAKLEEHMGPGDHPSGSPQEVHAGTTPSTEPPLNRAWDRYVPDLADEPGSDKARLEAQRFIAEHSKPTAQEHIDAEASKALGFTSSPAKLASRIKSENVDMVAARMATDLEVVSWYEKRARGLSSNVDPAPIADHLKAFANYRIRGWATTASDNSPEALALQMAAADVFAQSPDVLRGAVKLGHLEPTPMAAEGVWRAAHGAYADKPELYRAFVRATYAETQAKLKALGIKEVVLSRGMGVYESDVPDPFLSGGLPRPKIKPNEYDIPKQMQQQVDFTVQANPLSSWSHTRSTARAFTSPPTWKSAGVGASYGMVIEARIPASRIVSTAVTGLGCLDEGEWIVAGGELNVRGQLTVYQENVGSTPVNLLPGITVNMMGKDPMHG